MLNNQFGTALLISVGLHSIIVAPWPNIEFDTTKRPEANIEVTYYKIPELERIEIREGIKKLAPKETPVKVEQKEIEKEEPQETKEPLDKEKVEKELTEKAKITEMAKALKKSELKKILIETSPEVESNISYLSYSDQIREKIRLYLYRNYAKSMGSGEITLGFTLNSNGTLKAVAILNKSPGSSPDLEDSCILSVKKSSPFKPFPKDLDLAELSFKIPISFKPNN